MPVAILLCRPGSAPGTPRWWPAGPDSVWRCFSRCTPGPSTAPQESLDHIWTAARRGTDDGEQAAVSHRIQPPTDDTETFNTEGRTPWPQDVRPSVQVLGSNQRRRCRQICRPPGNPAVTRPNSSFGVFQGSHRDQTLRIWKTWRSSPTSVCSTTPIPSASPATSSSLEAEPESSPGCGSRAHTTSHSQTDQRSSSTAQSFVGRP